MINKLHLCVFESYFITGLGFGVSSENLIMKFYDLMSSFYQVTDKQNLAINSVPLTIFVETGIFGYIAYSSILPILILLNKNFKFSNVKNIFCLLIVIQLTQFTDISLLRFHMITFLFAIYLGISCNKSAKLHG